MAAETAYALVQVAHNFGAVAVVGSPAAAWLWVREQRRAPSVLMWLVGVGWWLQIASGVGFAATSYLSRGELPETSGVALIALSIKVGCAICALSMVGVYAWRRHTQGLQSQIWVWPILSAIGAVALVNAALLRWFG
ncbi:MAG: hypothetical protein AABY83_02720 [Pseudomonadota bacterium]